MNKPNIDMVKVAEIGGLVLTVAATVLSGWAGTKKTDRKIVEAVEEHFKNQA